MFDWVKNLFEPKLKSISLSQLIDLADSSDEIKGTFQSLVNNAYKKNGVVFGAVQLVSSAVGAVPWVVLKQDSQGEKIEIREHPLAELMKRPNPRAGGARFFEQLVVYLLVSGSNYILKVEGGGKTRGLYNLRPDLVSLRKENDPDSGWVYTPDPNRPEKKTFYLPEEILPLHIFDPLDEYSGLSPIEVAGLTIEQSNFSRKWNRNLLKNNARPTGLLKATGNVMQLTKEQVEQIESKFAEKYSGFGNAGRIPVLSGSLDWVQTGMSPGEMEGSAGQKVSDRLTSFTMGVASQLLGDTEASTFSNYAEARKSLYQENIIPLMTWLRDELNYWIVKDFGDGLTLDFQRDQIDALQEDRAMQWRRVGQADWMTIDEKREATGMDKLDSPAGGAIVTAKGVIITADGEVVGVGSGMPLDGDVPDKEEGSSGQGGAEGESSAPQPEVKDIAPKFKAFNLTTTEEMVAHGKAFDGDRDQFVERWDKKFAKRLLNENRSIMDAVRGESSVEGIKKAVDAVLKGDYKDWEKDYKDLYMEVGEHFARRIFAALPKGMPVPNAKMIEQAVMCKNWKQDDEEEIFVVRPFEEEMDKYLKGFAATRITGIDRVTVSRIRDQLAEGVSEGEDIRQLAGRIDGMLERTYAHRAETVARTEVINASNAGSHLGAKITGVAKTKTWLSILDGRTRTDHFTPADLGGLSGQVKKFKEPFTIKGFQLMWPGDSSLGAPAYEVINCRCTQFFGT